MVIVSLLSRDQEVLPSVSNGRELKVARKVLRKARFCERVLWVSQVLPACDKIRARRPAGRGSNQWRSGRKRKKVVICPRGPRQAHDFPTISIINPMVSPQSSVGIPLSTGVAIGLDKMVRNDMFYRHKTRPGRTSIAVVHLSVHTSAHASGGAALMSKNCPPIFLKPTFQN